MNEGLIKAWNNVVSPEDTVYQLGDLIFGGIKRWKEILPQLNGKIIHCRGNHDSGKVVRNLAWEGYFHDYHEVGCYIKHEGYQMWLTHYPMDIGLRAKKYSISGHIHSTPNEMVNQINVGVDSALNSNRPFGQPISLEELIEHLDTIEPQLIQK